MSSRENTKARVDTALKLELSNFLSVWPLHIVTLIFSFSSHGNLLWQKPVGTGLTAMSMPVMLTIKVIRNFKKCLPYGSMCKAITIQKCHLYMGRPLVKANLGGSVMQNDK